MFIYVSIFFIAVFLLREFAALRRSRRFKYLLTPLVTVSIIFIPVIAAGDSGLNRYNALIICALILSLVGDTLLMIEETDLLKYGMIYFLAAHVMYASAFVSGYTFRWWNLVLLAFLIIASVSHVKRISSAAGRLTIPVAVYMTAIIVMIFFAVTQLNSGVTAASLMAASGALLFGVSDYLISVNNFLRKIENSTVYTWLLYAPAQFLIAASTLSVF
jgi:uncharacterized membrane protein YhhN